VDIHDLQIKDLTAHVAMPVQIVGRINGQWTGQGEGFTESQIASNFIGQGKIDLKDGRILDVNILKTVLNKLSFIPDVVAKIEQNLPEKYKEKLEQKDTVLEDVTIDASIRDGALQITRAEMNVDGFMASARGKVDFHQNLELWADLYIAADLSASMIAAAQELSYFLDDRNQIHIPFKPYSGALKDFYMYPDIEGIGMEIIKNRGREELRNVLKKALGAEDEPSAQPTQTGEPPVPEQKEVSPEEAVIEKILDIIPIFQ
jgi:hypothetical protein